MQMVGQLASGVAHNFNNIISAILGYSEMASSDVKPDGKAARRIAEIERAAERGRDLVDGILTFGRRSDARSSLVSVSELLNETASLLRASLPSRIELVVRARPKPLPYSASGRSCSRSLSTCAGTRRRQWGNPAHRRLGG